MGTVLMDVRLALRSAKNNPAFTFAVVCTLALGIGLNLAVWDSIEALLFRKPQQIFSPERLIRVSVKDTDPVRAGVMSSFPGFLSLHENVRLMEVAAQAANFTIDFGRGAEAREVHVDYVSSSYFPVLRVKLIAGRAFTAGEDESEGGPAIAVIACEFWQHQLGGDLSVLDRDIWLGSRQFRVIGVAPKGFTGTGLMNVDVWLPIGDFPPTNKGEHLLTDRGARWLETFGRLRDGTTPQQAEIEATTAYRHSSNEVSGTIRLDPYFSGPFESLTQSARVSLWSAAVAFMVMLVACANVANLFLVRAAQREYDTAVRLQLGASRKRLLFQSLVDSAILSTGGTLSGLFAAAWTRPLAQKFLLPPNFHIDAFLNWQLLGASILLAVLGALFSGLIPAWRASRPDLIETLKLGVQANGGGQSFWQSGTIISQVGLTLVLTVGAGLFISSLRNIRAINFGFDADHMLLATIQLNKSSYSQAEISDLYARLRLRAERLPGIEHAALSTTFPFNGGIFTSARIPDAPPGSAEVVSFDAVSFDYFATMGMNILQGRPFSSSYGDGTREVAIVSESVATHLWPDRKAVGSCLLLGRANECVEVVGVVPDIKRSSLFNGNVKRLAVYVPLAQSVHTGRDINVGALLLRTVSKPSAMSHPVSEALQSFAPDSNRVDVRPISAFLDGQTRTWRIAAQMFTIFGAIALMLTGVGVYGIMTFFARGRMPEIGIRIALGAGRSDILRAIVWHGLKLVGLGILFGAVLSTMMSYAVRGLLYAVHPADAVTYISTCAILLFTSLLSSAIPAWRAAHLDPTTTLRHS